ncbi:hypothetical protein P5V15_011521 [Pogonomyrmex californicus]
MNEYWDSRIRNISHTKSNDMFPEINRLFRKKDEIVIPPLKLNGNNIKILIDANVNTNDVAKDSDGNFVIYDIHQKLNVLGAYFASTNIQNSCLGKPKLNKIIENNTKAIINEIENDQTNNKSICRFHDLNTADSPIDNTEIPYFFTNSLLLKKKFKKLNNKKSSGRDQISNFVLKHIPDKIIYYYTILFNNMLNNLYFHKIGKKPK